MKKLPNTNPNSVLAETIFKELVAANLIAKDNKEFSSMLAEGKLKDSDWRTNLLDRIHRKAKVGGK